MTKKLFEVPTLLGTTIYAYDVTEGGDDSKVYHIVHCDDEGNEKILYITRFRVVKERCSGDLLQREVNRITDVFDEGMRFGQKILKEGFKNRVKWAFQTQ